MQHKYALHTFAALLVFWFASSTAPAADALALASPNGQVEFRLTLQDARLSYTVAFQGKPVIEASALGIVVDGVSLAEGAQLGRAERYRTNETYPWCGVHSTAVDRSNGAKFQVKHAKTGTAYTIEARAYNDGIAFRFIVPGAAGTERVPDEATAFRLPAGSTVWYHDFEGHYEALHVKKAVEEVAAGDWAAPPVTFQLPGSAGYASITEGALVNYAGMGLQADGQRGFAARLGHTHPASYPFRLRYKDDVERMTKPAAIAGTITTPWRVIMIGADLNALVNCDIVNSVSAPPDPKIFPQGLKTEWIKPGRAVWRYLDGGETGLEGMKQFADYAHELGFEYNVIEGFWAKWSEEQLKELVDYSRQRGVGIVLWKHSRDLRDPASRRKFFEMAHRAGAAGAKIDFFDHEAKEVVDHYEACLRDAAEFHMIVDFHGANKPTGLSRTWPNELTREAIRGMESSKSLRARHDATWPFTRMLAGHADYTPTVFSARRNDTTWAHQIATAAILTSPLLVYGGHPKSFLENPAVEVIKAIPSVWDETIALPISEIGEVAALARRKDDVWFLAVVNGPTARTVNVPLSFMKGKRQAILVRDSKEGPAAVDVEKAVLGPEQSIRIELQAGGGFIVMLK
jgi:alpha-glucosidase